MQRSIKALMRRKMITQQMVAEAIGLHQAAVSRVLGNKQMISLIEAQIWAELLGISIDEFGRHYRKNWRKNGKTKS